MEMEALTAVSVAALTIYDMCKAVQKDMEITNIRLLEKSGGQSGHDAGGDGPIHRMGESFPAFSHPLFYGSAGQKAEGPSDCDGFSVRLGL